jgi:hypothetical protein
MTKEDRELVIIDISGRLHYGIICECLHSNAIKATAIDTEDLSVYYFDCDEWESIEHCKPYLRPMSSMTEEEKEEFDEITLVHSLWGIVMDRIPKLIDWLNKKMFDYRGLIEKGLALEAPKGMYN